MLTEALRHAMGDRQVMCAGGVRNTSPDTQLLSALRKIPEQHRGKDSPLMKCCSTALL